MEYQTRLQLLYSCSTGIIAAAFDKMVAYQIGSVLPLG